MSWFEQKQFHKLNDTGKIITQKSKRTHHGIISCDQIDIKSFLYLNLII